MSAITAQIEVPVDAPVACEHCGLDVPAGLVDADAAHQFCCSGCATVYGIISGSGLSRYYDMRRALEREKTAVVEHEPAYETYDHDAIVERYSTLDAATGLRSATLTLEGLHCGACVWLVERLGRVVGGVVDARADYGRSTAHVRWDPSRASFAAIARGLHALGYPARLPRAQDQDMAKRRDARRQLARIGIAGALAGNIMLVTIALYAGVFEGIEARWFSLFRWVSAGLGLLTVLWPGSVFFRGAIGALRARSPHLDLPIALALAVGATWGVVNTVRGSGEIYFDSLSVLVFLLLVGRFIQSQQQRRAANAVDLVLAFMPATIRVVDRSGAVSTKPAELIGVGDTVRVLAGESLPVDGRVIAGESDADLSILTGESRPVRVGVGDTVWAGSVNRSAPIDVVAEHTGERTRAARLMNLVAEASANTAPIVQRANRLAGWFVVVVASLAVLTVGLWWSVGATEAIEHATALLIVTCPCALGLATPLSLSATISRLSRRGVLVKGGEHLERLSEPGLVLLDKTGTLTTGDLAVVGASVDDATLADVRALESVSAHPIARAFADGSRPEPPAGAREHPGLGVEGVVDRSQYLVGSARFLQQYGVELAEAVAWRDRACGPGQTPVYVARGGQFVGGIVIEAVLRPGAVELASELRSLGWRVGLLSGDEPTAVDAIARRLSIAEEDAHARITAEQKLDVVREARARGVGPVVMVGDGVNDAAALAQADIGVAINGGSDASIDAADVLLQSDHLAAVAGLLREARRSIARIKLCIVVSLAYNSIAACLAIAGLVHPLLAAVLMPASSITVVSIAISGARRR